MASEPEPQRECWSKLQPMRIKSGEPGRSARQSGRHDGAARDGLFRRENKEGDNQERERCQRRRRLHRHRRATGGKRAELSAVRLRGSASAGVIHPTRHVHARHGHPRHGGNRPIAAAQHDSACPGHETHGNQCTAEQGGEQQCCKPPTVQPSLGRFVSHAASLAHGSLRTQNVL
jgi:hypothetical protein